MADTYRWKINCNIIKSGGRGGGELWFTFSLRKIRIKARHLDFHFSCTESKQCTFKSEFILENLEKFAEVKYLRGLCVRFVTISKSLMAIPIEKKNVLFTNKGFSHIKLVAA
jgi:hypothetical protein